MLFNSYLFILFFLPICVVGYFGLNHFHFRLGQVFLTAMSLWFYGYFHPGYLVLIAASMLGNYLAYLAMRHTDSRKLRKLSLWGGVLFDLGLLFYFKYFNFFVENINALARTDFVLEEILLPLGISFFTFQQISFLADAYRGEVVSCDLLSYASFVTFFPQLIAGPIVSHDELIPQFSDASKKKPDWGNLSMGLYIFALGLGKKVLLADTFGNAANWGFANVDALDATNAVLTMLSYTIQLYFDFSGYCDMAIGLGKMLNIDLPLNFDSPYKALTIADFWKRWHMTLTRFFTKYVYIPLGGSRKGSVRTYLNILLIFVLSGLWHGANWTFVLWGLCHGIFMAAYRRFRTFFDKLHPALNWLLTFSFVNAAWVLFRADSIEDAVRLLNRIVKMDFGPIAKQIADAFRLPEFLLLFRSQAAAGILDNYPYLFVGILFALALWILLGEKNAYEKMQNFKPTAGRGAATVLLLVWCVMSLSGVSTFLYFNF
ncbi:MAG: MBOAT family protein [Muribaculum sp.]|nr:MBOAT family protein [Muribaculum sp.]